LIGDQGDRGFWRSVKEKVPKIDILVDDGSHLPEHQIITLEEMLPHMASGGVFVCEDVRANKWNPYRPNYFWSYIYGLSTIFNWGSDADFVKAIDSIHLYPFMVVIEKATANGQHRTPFKLSRRGTEWETFFGRRVPA
jgi:hypothetical protein